jgi:catechol 2,3-dioxygenase-like lactoylglutathione lyase family enzyme
MDWKLELIVLPVSDVDKAKDFYTEQLGFTLDVDHRPSDSFRVVQLTPPGSACSITIGVGITQSAPGSVQGLHLIVADIEAARTELLGRAVDASDFFHFGPQGQVTGLSPERADYETFFTFSDPDGNGWLVQEVGFHRK